MKILLPPFFKNIFLNLGVYQLARKFYRISLKYQLESVKCFKNIKQVGLLHPDANIPFTHNRPHEDLCLIAQKL